MEVGPRKGRGEEDGDSIVQLTVRLHKTKAAIQMCNIRIHRNS